MKTTLYCLVLTLLALLLCSDEAQARKWTDATGVFSVEAELLGFADGKVRLKKQDGAIVELAIERLSDADQAFARAWQVRQSSGVQRSAGPEVVRPSHLTGKPQELAHDDGKAAGKFSIAGSGHAVRFQTPDDAGPWYLTAIRLHGARYGTPQPPKEDFHFWLCDENMKVLVDCPVPYATFQRGPETWVTLKGKPTQVPTKFVVCVSFDPEQTKGVYVSYDEKPGGNSLLGIPGGEMRPFEKGDWMIRATLDRLKPKK